MKWLTTLDLQQNEIQNARVQNLASAPSSPVEGQIYANTTTHQLGFYTGSGWVYFGSGSGTVTSVGIAPPSCMTVANSPVTSSGTINLDFATSGGNQVLATPDGEAGAADYRALVVDDIPTLTAGKISDFDTQVRANKLSQMATPAADVSFGGFKITNLGTPTTGTDAVTKTYADALATGFNQKPTATVATAAALPACTYANGTSGVGATLTGNSNGALTVDSYAVAAGDTVLVVNQSPGLQNGLYTVTQAGSGGTPFILTRSTYMDTTAEFARAFIPVEDAGTDNANSIWLCTNSTDPTVGTTAIVFVRLNKATDLQQGAGISISGNTLSLASGVATPGTYTSVTVDTYGRVTAGADIVTSNGIVARTASGTFTNRTVTGTAGRVSISNGDGVSGNPTVDLASGVATPGTYTSVTVDTYGRVTAGADIITSNGIAVRTASGTFTNRSVAGTATRISVSNGDGVSGNPTVDLASGVATPGTYTSVTVDTYGRVTAGTDIVTSNGMVARTASGTFANRTITGTSNRLTVTNGDGVSGNPTLDISSSYAGQNTIVTVGTVTTGTWTATAVGVLYGGTGATSASGARTNLGAAGKYTALIGNGSATSIAVTQATHGLATDGAMVAQVFDASTGAQVLCDVTINNANGTVTFGFAVAPTTNSLRIVIIG